MSTDAGRSFVKEWELIEQHSLDAAIRMFINRWSPNSDDGPRQFECDFIQIVQRIYRDAQAPLINAFADVIAARPEVMRPSGDASANRR